MNEQTKKQIRTINQRIKELEALYHAVANRLGISDGEVTVWSVLLTAEQDYSQQELCELLSLSRQTVNSIISKMVRKCFVYLEHIPGTRNEKTIHLTPEGRDYGQSEILWLLQADERAIEQADPHQVQICIEMIETFTRCLKNELDIHQKNGKE